DAFPFYRAYENTTVDHVYTTNQTRITSTLSLRREWKTPLRLHAPETCIHPARVCGGAPFYRLCNSVGKDNFYTTLESEMLDFIANQGYD
ncbi:hypothetical protein K438DRAFT_1587466, partial [Mycena galopus ATCC 62051]